MCSIYIKQGKLLEQKLICLAWQSMQEHCIPRAIDVHQFKQQQWTHCVFLRVTNYSLNCDLNSKISLQQKQQAGSDDVVMMNKKNGSRFQTDTIYSSDVFPANRQKACCLCLFYLFTPKYTNSTSETTHTQTHKLSRNKFKCW